MLHCDQTLSPSNFKYLAPSEIKTFGFATGSNHIPLLSNMEPQKDKHPDICFDAFWEVTQ